MSTELLRVAVASGKGGTGKTTIATNLATVLAHSGAHAAYADCDVEEPNGHLFLQPTIQTTREVSIPVPEVDESRCSLCGACGRACRYSAILTLPNKVLTFPKLCHGCGGCTIACPTGALREVPRKVGAVERGEANQLTFIQGKLDVGEAMSPPVINAVIETTPAEGTVIIDAPPGTSCPVIAAVKPADVVLLVSEPTPFGLNDLKLAVEMVRALNLPFGVALNRAGVGDNGVLEYCTDQQIPILIEIPNDRRIAQAYSRGELCTHALPELKPLFLRLGARLRELAQQRESGLTPKPTAPGDHTPPADSSTHVPIPSDRVRDRKGDDIAELVVISGKGGTGKTSIVASFAALAQRATVADCDVDAADLHLVLDPTPEARYPFSGGKTAQIDPDLCAACGACASHCRFGAILDPPVDAGDSYWVDPLACEGCGVCVDICPTRAATLVATTNGEWFVSNTRHGPMVHARLGIAQENSGKLVSLVRREAKAVAASTTSNLLICDGTPGIGCPVIASVTGAQMVLVVTEPTLSGLHDLKRVAELCRQLAVKAAVCINKADLNPQLAATIEAEARHWAMPFVGTIRYDDSVTAAQIQRRAVVEHADSPAAADIRALWERVQTALAAA